MKKVWNRYSYVIVLVGLSIVLSFILSFQNEDKYIKVTVTQGDTIWAIANEYSGESESHEGFVSWVKKHNHLTGDQIYPGDKLVIPVSKESLTAKEFAIVK